MSVLSAVLCASLRPGVSGVMTAPCSRIWMSCCKRVGTSSRFEIEIKELRVPRTKNIGDDVRWIMVEMQKQFEAWVREAPEQWMWSNRRWS